MANQSDDTPQLAGWGDGFIRGYELAVDRMCMAIRKEFILAGFEPRRIEVAIDWAYMNVNSIGPKRKSIE